MTFDEKMKARAARESCPLPDGFDERMNALLDTLPVKTETPRRRPMRRTIVIGAAAAIFIVGAAATPTVISMAQGAVDYFHAQQDFEYASQQGVFEQYNAAVGVSQTVGGRTLTIDNIAVDDSYINLFFTLKSETPIGQDAMFDDAPTPWRAAWAAPAFWANVDGKSLETTGEIENEAYFMDDHTLKGMRRIAIQQSLPDQFDLLLYTGGTSALADSEFQFRLSVDKSAVAVKSRTVEPRIDLTVYDHNVRIERLSISPFGSTITLSEAATDPFHAFLLRDDKGNYLPVINRSSTGSNGWERVSNTYEFWGADENTRSITLIPISHEGADAPAQLVTGALDSLPLTGDPVGGFTLESLEIGEKKAVATFSMHGAVYETRAQFYLTDKTGGAAAFTGDTYTDCIVDRETGRITATNYYPEATAAEVAQVTGVAFFQDAPLPLLENQAVIVNLQ